MIADRRRFLRTVGLTGLAGAGRWHSQERGMSLRFPALAAADARSLYLDSAATTHRPQAVIDAIARFYVDDNANPARVHARARRAAAALSDARAVVARFLNAADPLEIVFTRGTTEAINLVASSWAAAILRAGDEVVLTRAEHASNLLPWVTAAGRAGAAVRVLDVDDGGRLRVDQLGTLLSARTRLVVFSHVSNVLGIVNPVRQIVEVAHAAGARVFVDGAQGAPHVPVDVQALGCDFYAFSGHKLCGPMGSGVLWTRRELLEAMPPYHLGSNMAHAVDFEGEPEFEHGALKFQAGTPDVAAPVGLAAAIRLLQEMGADALWAHDRELVERARARFGRIRGLKVFGDLDVPERIPVFSFTIAGRAASDIAAALDARGIAVRAGDLAALPLLKRLGVAEAVRASAYIYTAPADIDRLADALEQVAG